MCFSASVYNLEKHQAQKLSPSCCVFTRTESDSQLNKASLSHAQRIGKHVHFFLFFPLPLPGLKQDLAGGQEIAARAFPVVRISRPLEPRATGPFTSVFGYIQEQDDVRHESHVQPAEECDETPNHT